MPKNRAEYEKGVRIDKNNLDEMLVQHAELFRHVAAEVEELNSWRDTVKNKLEVRQAELGDKFRREAADNNEKITENGLAEKLKRHPDIQKIMDEYLDAKYELGLWMALKETYIQRSFALRELTQLRIKELMDIQIEQGIVGGRAQLLEVQSASVTAARRNRLSGKE